MGEEAGDEVRVRDDTCRRGGRQQQQQQDVLHVLGRTFVVQTGIRAARHHSPRQFPPLSCCQKGMCVSSLPRLYPPPVTPLSKPKMMPAHAAICSTANSTPCVGFCHYPPYSLRPEAGGLLRSLCCSHSGFRRTILL